MLDGEENAKSRFARFNRDSFSLEASGKTHQDTPNPNKPGSCSNGGPGFPKCGCDCHQSISFAIFPIRDDP
jgi:hypothetical protein